jgi:opacity protein-like surface antigen
MKTVLAAVAAILAGSSAGALAQNAAPDFYVRLDTGYGVATNAERNLQADLGSTGIVGVGVGTWLNPSWRVDVTLSYRPGYDFEALDTTFSPGTLLIAKGKVDTWSGMLNAYYDLPALGPVRPYLGAGIGFSRVHVDNSTILTTGRVAVATIDGKTDTELSWQVGTGFGYALTPRTTLEVGYRYFDQGVGTSADTGTIGGAPARGLTYKGNVRSNEFHAGIRFGF